MYVCIYVFVELGSPRRHRLCKLQDCGVSRGSRCCSVSLSAGAVVHGSRGPDTYATLHSPCPCMYVCMYKHTPALYDLQERQHSGHNRFRCSEPYIQIGIHTYIPSHIHTFTHSGYTFTYMHAVDIHTHIPTHTHTMGTRIPFAHYRHAHTCTVCSRGLRSQPTCRLRWQRNWSGCLRPQELRMYACVHVCTCMCVYVYTYTYTYTYTHMHAHAFTRIHMQHEKPRT